MGGVFFLDFERQGIRDGFAYTEFVTVLHIPIVGSQLNRPRKNSDDLVTRAEIQPT